MTALNPNTESAKQRSLRVTLDHYRQPDSITRTKLLLSIVAAGAAVAYVAWLLLAGEAGRRHASPGPLTTAHATWDYQCAACHLDFHPLRADAVDWASLASDATAHRQAADQTCVKCHAGPPHHRSAKAEEVATCAACHRDHRGREADIVRPADTMCTTCHANIAAHRTTAGISPLIENVTALRPPLANDPPPHPKFRSLDGDPGNIKFNHWLHMQPGIAVQDAKQKLKLDDLDEEQRPRYMKFVAEGLIQLDCSACHELGHRKDGDPGSGDYMLPIAFEQHCRACHPLELRLDHQRRPFAQLPHGLSAERLRAAINGLLLASEDWQRAALASTPDESGALPLVPGKTLGKNLAEKIRDDLGGRQNGANLLANAMCQECHYPAKPPLESAVPIGLVEAFLPANIPSVWFQHGRFDHSAHRQVECRTCHAAAYAFEKHDQPQFVSQWTAFRAERDLAIKDGWAYTFPLNLRNRYAKAQDDAQVMIAGLENCVACHAPARGGQGGARHDCAECHLYHGRDNVLGIRPGGPAGNSPDRKVGVNEYQTKIRRSGGPTPSAAVERRVSRGITDISQVMYRPSGPLAESVDGWEPRPDGRGYYMSALRASDEQFVFTSLRAQAAAWVGAASCAAANCHGDARPNAPAWRSALQTWLARDPHAQAWDVLWTFRAREMTRLLAPRPVEGKEPAPLSDDQHFTALQDRCIACHATPPAATRATSSSASYALGVHCESCHGPASQWLHTHDRSGFARSAAPDFIDTKDLASRAAACMLCHVGPSDNAGQPQVVNHDLIAAGHPRLSFEFHAYFQSLPTHWDRTQDEARHPGTFHFRSWLEGQQQQARQLAQLDHHDQQRAEAAGPDFALVDCYACHHELANARWRQIDRSRAAPAGELSRLGPLWAASPPVLPKEPDPRDLPPFQRLRLAHTLLSRAADQNNGSWDRAVGTYLAMGVIAADFPPQSHPMATTQISAFQAALGDLGRYLAKDCFLADVTDRRQPTQYDSPTRFDPQRLRSQVQAVLDALTHLQTALAASGGPP